MQPESIDCSVDVGARERDVLDSLAVVLAQVFLDLALVVLRLVDRDANLPAGAGHGARDQSGLLAFDVEIADLAEVEQLLVEARPMIHPAAHHIVREVIDPCQPGLFHSRLRGDRPEVHVIDRLVSVAIHQVDQRATDALDARNVQFHGTGALRARLRPQLDSPVEGVGSVLHPKGHCAGGRSVLPREALGEGVRLRVDDEIDVALIVQGHVLRAVSRHHRKAEPFEQRSQQLRVGSRVLDELESVGAHRVGGGPARGWAVHRGALRGDEGWQISFTRNYYTARQGPRARPVGPPAKASSRAMSEPHV